MTTYDCDWQSDFGRDSKMHMLVKQIIVKSSFLFIFVLNYIQLPKLCMQLRPTMTHMFPFLVQPLDWEVECSYHCRIPTGIYCQSPCKLVIIIRRSGTPCFNNVTGASWYNKYCRKWCQIQSNNIVKQYPYCIFCTILVSLVLQWVGSVSMCVHLTLLL